MTKSPAAAPAFVSGLGGGNISPLEPGLEAVHSSLSLDILTTATGAGHTDRFLVLAEDRRGPRLLARLVEGNRCL